MAKSSELTFGHDCEVFVATQDGAITAPNKFIQESKIVYRMSNDGGMNRDGMALEFNPDPSTEPAAVAQSTQQLMDLGAEKLQLMGMHIISSIGIDLKQVAKELRQNLPEDVFEIGCLPDQDAYTGEERIVNLNGKRYTKRFAGGHIAVGHRALRNCTTGAIDRLVRLFDAKAGLFSVRFSTPDSIVRRKTYGTAGAYRYKREKGIVEYRTPDAGWLWGMAFEKMCEHMRQAFVDWQAGIRLEIADPTVKAINTCDKKMALQLLGEA